MNLQVLREANIQRRKEWGGPKLDVLFYSNELGGETGEALNVVKKLVRERLGVAGSRATVEQLAEELADIIICVDLVASCEGIDLSEAVPKKFNATSDKVGLSTKIVGLYLGDEDLNRIGPMEAVVV